MDLDPEIEDLLEGLTDEELEKIEKKYCNTSNHQTITLEMLASMEEKPTQKGNVDMSRLRSYMKEEAAKVEDRTDYVAYVKKEKPVSKIETPKPDAFVSDESLFGDVKLSTDELSELADLLDLGETNDLSSKICRYEEPAFHFEDDLNCQPLNMEEEIEKVKKKDPSTVKLIYNNQGEIKPKIFRILCEELKSSDCIIQHLELANCGIRDIYIRGMSEALKVNKSVITLNLETNVISVEGFADLFEALKKNTSLKILKLANQTSNLGYEFENILTQMLEVNQTICKVSHHFVTPNFRNKFERLTVNRKFNQ